jgi:fumarate reductase flavoprotein subunit
MGKDMVRDRYDVVIIGAGLAGHAAALSANEAGADVLLVEKMPDFGGDTLYSGGAFCFAMTDEQEAADVADSEDFLRQDLTAAGAEKMRADLIDLYVSEQRDTYRWLKRLGLKFTGPMLSPGQSVARSHSANMRAMLDLLHETFLSREGCSYTSDTQVEKISRDGNGVARIVHLRIGDRLHEVTAERAVVLATGGFARNPDLLMRFAPELQPLKKLGGLGSTGDGLRIGMALGADIRDFGWLNGAFGAILPKYPAPTAWEDNDTQMLHGNYMGGIILNKLGKRFVNESISYNKVGKACLEQPDAVCFQLFDQTVMNNSRPEPLARNAEGALERGLILKAGSIREAAQAMGLDPDVVEAEVAAYNADIANGRDRAFGRETIINDLGKPLPIQTAPFYIYACTTCLIGTYAGLVANDRMALVDVFGEQIPGVFVAGEVVGGFHGPAQVSGTGLGKAAVFGRRAGLSAAQSALAEAS